MQDLRKVAVGPCAAEQKGSWDLAEAVIGFCAQEQRSNMDST